MCYVRMQAQCVLFTVLIALDLSSNNHFAYEVKSLRLLHVQLKSI